MNYALAREIYGREPWAIQSTAITPLLSAFRDGKYDENRKLNSMFFIGAASGAKSVNDGNSSTKIEKVISETNIDGVILKNGGASTNGMVELSAELIKADSESNVIGHLFGFDTPGGSVAGMNYMVGTVRGLNKPKVGIVKRSAISASAGYGILAEMDFIFCEADDSEVGSVGVICGTAGVPNGEKDSEGQVHYVVYSDKAVDKNAAEELAINKGDTSLMQDRANKIGDEFIAQVKAARPFVKDSHLTGKMFKASEVLGTMVDAIGTKMDAISKIIELSGTKINTLTKSNKAMTAAELLAQHPTVHAEILAAGESAEQERVKTWMAFAEIDPEAVQKGILSGKAVSGSEQATFLVKAAQGNALNAIKRDSAGNIVPAEAETKIEVVKTAKQLSDEKEFATAFPKLIAKGITLEKFNATLKAN